MALVEYGTAFNGFQSTTGSLMKKENIRVAVRVRPPLPHEVHRDEVVYYPMFEEGALQVTTPPMKEPLVDQSRGRPAHDREQVRPRLQAELLPDRGLRLRQR